MVTQSYSIFTDSWSKIVFFAQLGKSYGMERTLHGSIRTQANPTMNTPTAIKSDASFKRLATTQPVWFYADACLKLRPGNMGCEACREACPVQAIRVEDDRVELAPGCMGCGQCASVCPSGALRVEGFDELLPPLPGGEAVAPLRFECRRVPRKLAGNARQVPCLGGIALSTLIGLVARSSSAVTLVDRGWCATCPSGAGNAPMKALADAVRKVIEDVGLPDERFPRVHGMPTPHDLALPMSAMADGPPMPRRAFFGALLKRTAEAAAAVRSPDISRLAVETTRGALSASPVIYHARKRMAASLKELAGQAGKALSAKFFPDMSISGRCALHGVCSAVCPSGALAVIRNEFSAGLCFDPELCLACGLCVRHCPTGSLSMSTIGNAADTHSMDEKQLNLYPLRDCVRCGKSFVSHGHDDTCPSCHDNRKMAESLFGTSFADGIQ